MAEPLWQWEDLVAAAHGDADGTPALRITGFSIDTRSLEPGDVFVALKRRARRARVRPRSVQGRGGSRHRLAQVCARRLRRRRLAARRRSAARAGRHRRAPRARAATRASLRSRAASARPAPRRCCACASTRGADACGREVLQQPLGRAAHARAHAARQRLRRLRDRHEPRRRDHAAGGDGAPARGCHHDGGARAPRSSSPRSRPSPRPRPRSSRAWCQAAPPCFPATTRTSPLLRERASAVGAHIVTFGYHEEADFRALQVDLGPKGSSVIAGHGSQRFPYRVGAPGEHYVRNSLAVLATLGAVGADAMRCLPGLARISAPPAGARARCSTRLMAKSC